MTAQISPPKTPDHVLEFDHVWFAYDGEPVQGRSSDTVWSSTSPVRTAWILLKLKRGDFH